MIKYYVWYGNDRNDIGYDCFEDAFDEAMHNTDATEIEKTTWNTEDSYHNYEPADEFEVVWKREEN